MNEIVDFYTLELPEELLNEYKYYISQCSSDSERGIIALSAKDVMKAHFLIAEYFLEQGDGLGGVGPKSMNLLESAIARQNVSLGDRYKWSDIYSICATLLYGLIKNHPFHDANKRTAFLSMLFLLERNNLTPSVGETFFEDFTVEIAESGYKKRDRYVEFVRRNKVDDPEISYISWIIRNNVRKLDREDYRITYNELAKILNRFGFYFKNPRHNYIDIYKKEDNWFIPRMLGTRQREVRVGHIGFPRWTAEVSRSDIKAVRRMTQLTFADGVDSAAFFRGVDPMRSLATTYRAPLVRLAGR